MEEGVIVMTVHPVHGGAHLAPTHGHHPMSVLAFGLAVVVSVVVVVAAAVFSIAFAVGGEDATSDNWVGVLAAVGLVGGVLASLGAFVLAVVGWLSHERSRLLWLPLLLFPALLAFVVLGEAFWWE
jgi:hypothetical protein